MIYFNSENTQTLINEIKLQSSREVGLRIHIIHISHFPHTYYIK